VRVLLLTASMALAGLSGCSKPNAANIELRKQNQDLRATIDSLTLERDAAQARIRAEESKTGTLQTLPEDRLAQLFTAHGLCFGRLTGGADLDPSKPGDEGIKVYVVPVDQDNEPIKAVGAFRAEAFDLADGGKKLGEWKFTSEEMRKNWYGALLHSYVLTLPWQKAVPKHSDVTLKMEFSDDLTQRVFEVQRVVQVNVPGAAGTSSTTTAVERGGAGSASSTQATSRQ
jgi:hypothetical protein